MSIARPEFEFEQTVSYVLARTSTAFRNSLERFMGTIGLHGGQTAVLLELWKEDGLRQVDLAKQLNLSAATVSKMLKKMADIDLVSLERVEDDARSTRVFLSTEGKAIRGEVEEQWHELEEYCLAGLTETERLVLFELLTKLRNNYTGRSEAEDDE